MAPFQALGFRRARCIPVSRREPPLRRTPSVDPARSCGIRLTNHRKPADPSPFLAISMVSGAIPESSPVLNAKPWSRVGRGANGVSGFLKNNTRPRSAWQEIVVFFKRPGHQLGSFRRSLRTRRGELDLPGTIPQNPERHNKLFLISIL
jgi:hypothetical protein